MNTFYVTSFQTPPLPPPLPSTFVAYVTAGGSALPPITSVPAPEPSLRLQEDAFAGAATAATKEKKSSWSKPSDRLIDIAPAMGSVHLPADSDVTRAAPRPPSSDGAGPVLVSSLVANLPTPSKPNVDNLNLNVSSSHIPEQQKFMQRESVRGGENGSNDASGGDTLANSDAVSLSSPISEESSTKMAFDRPMILEPLPRDQLNGNCNNWDHGLTSGGFLPQNHGGNENHRIYNHRRQNPYNGGSHGGNFHYNNYNNCHNHNRRGHEWYSYRNFPHRDIPFHQLHPSRFPWTPFIMPQAVPAPFIGHPAIQPFENPIGFYYMNPPFVPPPLSCQAPNPQLCTKILRQIEYYFSTENLCKDIFLRQNMEAEGWVHVFIIANFNRIKQLTNNTKLILDTMRTSFVIEVQGIKMRRRNDWAKWLLPPAVKQSISALSLKPRPQTTIDNLGSRFNSMAMETRPISQSPDQPDDLDRSSSGEFSRQQATGSTEEGKEDNSDQKG